MKFRRNLMKESKNTSEFSELTNMVKYENHAMLCHEHVVCYSPRQDNGYIIACLSWFSRTMA